MSTLMYRMRDASEVELAEANEGNMCAAYAGFGRWPDGELWATPATVVCLTGIPHPLFNGVFRPRLGPDVAQLDGSPVATTSLLLAAGVAGIFNVGTVPEARRKGIAAALVATVLREARALGFGVGVLQASEAGYPLYERLGFRQCCTYRHHVWTAGDVPRH